MSRGKSVPPADPQESYLLAADFLSFFSHPASLRILDAVRKREKTVPAISRKLGIAPDRVLNKLTAMERGGILVANARLNKNVYRMTDSDITKALDIILRFPGKNLKRTGKKRKVSQNNRQKRPS